MNAGESGKLANELLTKYKNCLPKQAWIKRRDVRSVNSNITFHKNLMKLHQPLSNRPHPRKQMTCLVTTLKKVCNFQDRQILLSEKQAS